MQEDHNFLPDNPDWDQEHLDEYVKNGNASHKDFGHGDTCAWCNEAISRVSFHTS